MNTTNLLRFEDVLISLLDNKHDMDLLVSMLFSGFLQPEIKT